MTEKVTFDEQPHIQKSNCTATRYVLLRKFLNGVLSQILVLVTGHNLVAVQIPNLHIAVFEY